MPYIKSDDGRREALQIGQTALSAGELNYQIFYYVKHHRKAIRQADTFQYMEKHQKTSKIIKKFVSNFLGKKPNYQRYNDMTGCLIRCYKEIKRRLQLNVKTLFIGIIHSYDDEIAKYEDTKIDSNGDVE